MAARIDHIGIAEPADLGVVDEVIEKVQIDIGDRDPGLEARMRHRDRHGRLAAPEQDRREAGPARDRLGEADVAQQIRAGRLRDRGARQPELLAAVTVDLIELRDGRRLRQQLRVVGLPILLPGCARPCHPADLALQVRQRLIDTLGGRVGLFRHRIGQASLDGAVADPGLGGAVDGEHEHHEPNQRHDIFGEQASAPRPDLVLDLAHPNPRARRPQSGGCASAAASPEPRSARASVAPASLHRRDYRCRAVLARPAGSM